MKIDVKQGRFVQCRAHDMRVPNFFEECARHNN
jgi:hypothetical protein